MSNTTAAAAKPDVDRTSVTVHMNKDLIRQFDKILSVTRQKTDKKNKGAVSAGLCPSGSVQRKIRKPLKKKGFVLRPSKLKLSHEPSFTTSNHFSFENCSKELESIMAPSGVNFEPVRPRSSSLPTAKKKPIKEDGKSNKSHVDSSTSKDRVVKKRKHNLGSDEEGRSKQPQRKNSSTCAQQARQNTELSQDIDRLADYLEESILLPKKMSYMAEMMYT